jgi:hypothetical protein
LLGAGTCGVVASEIGGLERWRAESRHNPLLIRGARQVGKMQSIREFGKKFDQFLEINV